MTPAEYDMLSTADHFQRHGIDALKTGRTLRASTARRCVSKGWLKETLCVLVDGDGWTGKLERWGVGYSLTAAGRDALAVERVRLGEGGEAVRS